MFLWFLIIGLFVLSFIGILYPIIPSSIALWAGFLIYHFFVDREQLTILFWVIVVIFTVILIVSDIIVNSYFVKKFGGSKWGERSAAIAVIVGSFIIPPFGILIIPFFTVIVVEMLQKRSVKEALLASIGSIIGFLGGAIAKVLIHILMIIWFILYVI